MHAADRQSPLRDPPAGSHIGVVYRDRTYLARKVATWLADALRADGGAIIVARVAHAELVRDQLRRERIDVAKAERDGHLVIVDADWLMSKFILDHTPDAEAFHALVKETIARVRAVASGPVRAWGEMVALLRTRGDHEAVRELERLWSEAIDAHGIGLLCTYEAEPTGERERALLQDVLASHAHVVSQPAEGAGDVVLAGALGTPALRE